MNVTQCPTPDRRQLSSILSDSRSRRLLACLQAGPLTVRDLAVALGAAELDCARSSVTADDRTQYRRALHHTHLPRLTDAGLVTRSSDGLVRYVSGALDRYEVRFPALDEPDHDCWPVAATALGRAYRYPLLSLVDADDPVSLSDLAARLVERDPSRSGAAPRRLAVSLHHVDLPKLAAVDLLAYEPERRTVRRTPATGTVL